MRALFPLFVLTGCSSFGTALSAVEELTLSATSGGEEALAAGGNFMSLSSLPASERPDPFRACDASGTYGDLFGRYDADANGDLDVAESDSVFGARGERSDRDQMRIEAQWAMFLAVYDLDGSLALEESERATLLDDFTVRCDALQARLLADFDADGDGALSDSEKETARAELEERHGEHREMEEGGAEGGGEGGREGGPPQDGERPGLGEPPPPLVDEFDSDADGALDDAELTTMRDTMRERIRGGEPLCGPPPQE